MGQRSLFRAFFAAAGSTVFADDLFFQKTMFLLGGSMERMSENLGRIYDRVFCAEYGTANPLYVRCCALIAEEIARRFQPASAVDWGCGAGLHVAALAEFGVHVLGVDGVEWPEEFRAPGIEFRRVDLSLACPEGIVPGEYDLSLCLDVMEHLPESDSQVALENITRGARLLLLSCAPPGQGGHHHVNEQPRRYWIKRLADMGWVYDRRATGQMERSFFARRDELPLSWMYHNLCVYRPS
jgi:SAM-dependent methyltransferase